MTTSKNVHFWEVINGDWVKLTLTPGNSIEFSHNEVTDEGWRSEWQLWYLCPDTGELRREYHVRERDCDGLYDHGGEQVCAPERIAAIPCLEWYRDREGYSQLKDSDTMRRPDWQDIRNYRRDHSAERAGY